MEVKIISIPTVMELAIYTDEHKEELLQNIYAMYMEKVSEAYKFVGKEGKKIIEESVDILEQHISDKEYLQLYPWQLYQFYADIRANYDELVVLVGRYKKAAETRVKYHRILEQRLNQIEALELELYGKQEIATDITKDKTTILTKHYNENEYKKIIAECDAIIEEYEDTQKEEDTIDFSDLDTLIAEMRDVNRKEKETATEKITDGMAMFSRLKALRNNASG